MTAIQNIQEFIERPNTAIRLTDHNTNEVLDDQLTKQKLVEDYNDNLKQALRQHIDGQTSRSILAQKKVKKNGYYINVDEPIKLDLTLKNAEPVRSGGGWPANAGSSAVNHEPMTQYQPQPQPQSTGMNGSTAKLLADSERYKDYKKWYEEAAKELKEKTKELEKVKEDWKASYDKLKEEFNDFKIDKKLEDKPGTIDKLVDAITSKPELLSGIMQALPQNVKQNQLGQATQTQGMQGANEEMDQQSKEIALAINNLSDSDTEKLIQVVNHYYLGTENFIPEFEAILQKHQQELQEKYQEHEQQQNQ